MNYKELINVSIHLYTTLVKMTKILPYLSLFCYTSLESRLMNGRPRIAVAELFLFTLIKRNGQSFGDYDFQKSTMIRRYCLPLLKVDH